MTTSASDLTSHQRKALSELIRKQRDYETLGFITAPTAVQRRTMRALVTKGLAERELPFRVIPRFRPTQAGRAVLAWRGPS